MSVSLGVADSESTLPVTQNQARKRSTSDEMASSTPSTTESIPASRLKPIPLLCCVCPEKPRFSDVSHLLTHIASKGHLHHETQTKLRSHQDSNAAVALQQYDRWYAENGIEVLLVERLRAKQVKGASRNKRNWHSPRQATKPKKKARRASDEIVIKSEEESYPDDCPIFPGFFPSTDAEFGFPDDFTVPTDALSLKGQVWPGMGKMDLANEEMKRTRNQRKPKSVIERMRRTSEGIEPTQVVMNTQFDVERVKGVYDDDSPVEDAEDPTPPPRKTKTRRKKPAALTEIPANVPRGDRTSRNKKNTRASKILEDLPKVETPTSTTSFSQDVFRDEHKLDSEGSASPTQRDAFAFRSRLGLHHSLDPILRSNLASPTPPHRDYSSHLSLNREAGRGKYENTPYTSSASPFGIGSFGHTDHHYPPILDNSMYYGSYRVPFAATAHYGSTEHDHYRLSSGNDIHTKPGEFMHAVGGESMPTSGSGPFSDIPSANPLLGQERTMTSHYHYPGAPQQLPGLSFTPINQNHKKRDESSIQAQEQRDPSMGVKSEAQISETQFRPESKNGSFENKDLWHSQGHGVGLGLSDFQPDLSL